MVVNINRLIELSKTKEELLSKYHNLTKTQNDLIQSEELEDFDKVLESKTAIMEKIDKLDAEFVKLYDKLKNDEDIESIEEIETSKYPELKELKEVISKISTILKDIDLIDKANMTLMERNLSKVKLGLKNVKNSKAAHRGYSHNPVSSIMIDEKK